MVLGGVFLFAKNMTFFIKGEICCISKVFPGHFCSMRGPSLVELAGGNNTLATTVHIRMNLSQRIGICYTYVSLYSYIYYDDSRYMYGHQILYQSMDQPGKVANSARGQLNRENKYFPVPVRARKFGLARWVWPSRPAVACSFLVIE